MTELLVNVKAFGTGLLAGVLFSLVQLPIPAPTVFAGISGIIGIWAGYGLVRLLRERLVP